MKIIKKIKPFFIDERGEMSYLLNNKGSIKSALLITSKKSSVRANLFIPICLYSLYRGLKYKTWLYLLEAPITLALVDTILFAFLKDRRGLELIKNNFAKLYLKTISKDQTT